MKFNAPLSSVTTNPAEAIKIIADSLIESRPEEKVVYRPIRKSDVFYDKPGRAGPLEINFKKLYPEAQPGNVVYFSTVFDSCADCPGYIRPFIPGSLRRHIFSGISADIFLWR